MHIRRHLPARHLAAALVVGALALTACGGDDDAIDPEPAPTTSTAAGATAAASPSTAASSPDTAPADTGTQDAGTFPVVIEHVFGSTEIPARPERVVTLGYGEGDIVAALGITPVAINASGTRNGVPTPWFDEAVDGDEVELLDLTDGINFEAVAGLRPDLILAVTSNIEARDYELLSEIAPTVAYQTGPFQDAWEDAALAAGEALGVEDEAADLVAGVDTAIENAATAHPDIADRTVSVVLAISADQIGVLNSPAENTVRTLTQLGMRLPAEVSALPVGPTGYSAVLSLEQTGVLDADVMLMYAINDDARDALTSSPVFANLPVNQRGDVLAIEPDVWTALRAPSVLSIPYAVDALVGPIEQAIND